jgi:hypothetical protein
VACARNIVVSGGILLSVGHKQLAAQVPASAGAPVPGKTAI